jgi:hypothetical protein
MGNGHSRQKSIGTKNDFLFFTDNGYFVAIQLNHPDNPLSGRANGKFTAFSGEFAAIGQSVEDIGVAAKAALLETTCCHEIANLKVLGYENPRVADRNPLFDCLRIRHFTSSLFA